MSNSTEFLTTNDEKKNHNSKVNDWWIPYLSSVNRKWKWTGWRFPSRPIVSDSITLIISYFLYHLGISGDQRTVSIRGTSFHADCLCWKSICIEMLVFLLQCYLTIQSISIKRHGFYYDYYESVNVISIFFTRIAFSDQVWYSNCIFILTMRPLSSPNTGILKNIYCNSYIFLKLTFDWKRSTYKFVIY